MYFGQDVEMTLLSSGSVQYVGPVGSVGSLGLDQWVGQVDVVTGCGHCVFDLLLPHNEVYLHTSFVSVLFACLIPIYFLFIF